MAPHWTVFERAGGRRRRAAGARYRPRPHAGPAGRASRPTGAGRQVADGVRAAMRDAGIDGPGRRAFRPAQVPAADRAAHRRSRPGAAPSVATRDTLKSMGLSRAASALGVAVALGEIERATLTRRRDRQRAGSSGRAAPAVRPASNCSGMRSSCSACRRAWSRTARHRPCGDDGCDRYRAGARRSRPARSGAAGQLPPAERGGSSPCWQRRRRAMTVSCAASATPCWTIPTLSAHAMPALSSAARWRDWSDMRKSTCPAAPSIRGRTAAGRSPSSSIGTPADQHDRRRDRSRAGHLPC